MKGGCLEKPGLTQDFEETEKNQELLLFLAPGSLQRSEPANEAHTSMCVETPTTPHDLVL